MESLTSTRKRGGRRRSLVFPLTMAIVVAVTIVRLSDSSTFSFWDDEFTHVFAARSWRASGTLQLPSGAAYTRAWPFTLLVALSFNAFGVSEFAARLPSVLAGAALLVAVFAVTRELFDDRVALVATALTAFDPLTSPLMTISRMYSLFVLVYFLLAALLFQTIERWRDDKPFLVTGVATILVGGLAVSTHLLSAFLVPGLAIYLAVSGYRDRTIGNKTKALIQLAASGVALAAVAAFVLRGGTANRAPAVADATLWYFPGLLARYALPATLMAAVGVWRGLAARNRPVAFMASVALGGLCTQALLFGTWLSPRYIAQYMPFIYILAAMGVFGTAGSAVKSRRESKSTSPALAALLLVAATAILWVGNDLPQSYTNTPDYRLARQLVLPSLKENPRQVVISTITLATEHYLGRSDYWLREKQVKFYTNKKSSGQLDAYTGARLISDPGRLAALMAKTRSGWIVLDHRVGNLSPETIAVIEKNSRLVAQDRRRLWLYHWDDIDKQHPHNVH